MQGNCLINDQALINKAGVDHEVFNDLNDLHAPVFRWCCPRSADGFVRLLTNRKTGKPSMLQFVGSLELVCIVATREGLDFFQHYLQLIKLFFLKICKLLSQEFSNFVLI